MPSTQRRVSNFPAVGRNVVTANLLSSAYSLAAPGCRSESLRSSYRNLIAPQQLSTDTMDNWFPANGFDMRMSSSCAASSPFQHQASDDAQTSALGDFQTDAAWWPSLAVNSRDRRSSPQRVALMSDAKLANTFQAMESWCHNSTATVDLNTPSAIAVVSVAPPGGVVEEEDSELVTTTKPGRKLGGGKMLVKSMSAPTSPSELRVAVGKSSGLGVQKATVNKRSGKRAVSQRENHIWSERQRRKGMNYLFSTLRSLLPHPTSKTDKSTVVGEIIKYIQSLQVKLEELTKKQQQVMAARTLSAFHHSLQPDVTDVTVALPKAFVSNGLTLVDHSGDPTCVTAITALPPPGRESCLASYLGSNVGLHVCGLNVFITTSSPRGRHGLLQQLLVTIHKYDLDVINANISTSNASIFHCLHCQASQDAEFLNNALHSALQSVINNFA